MDGGETRAQWREKRDKEDGSNSSTGKADQSFLRALGPGVPLPHGTTSGDAISQTIATMSPTQLNEVLAQMKVDFFDLSNDSSDSPLVN